jgi:chromate reductase, NAD(P)H dehydrogenase (quinone)
MALTFVTICGSLRARSSNAALLDAVSLLAPAGIKVRRYDGLASLPPFNPDDDVEPAPAAVRSLRSCVASADALVLSSPEYAHGVPGALKNALDWLVSGVEIFQKPVALLNPSPASRFAHAQLMETLRVMSATVVDDACITLPIAGRRLDAEGIAADAELSSAIRATLDALTAAMSASG